MSAPKQTLFNPTIDLDNLAAVLKPLEQYGASSTFNESFPVQSTININIRVKDRLRLITSPERAPSLSADVCMHLRKFLVDVDNAPTSIAKNIPGFLIVRDRMRVPTTRGNRRWDGYFTIYGLSSSNFLTDEGDSGVNLQKCFETDERLMLRPGLCLTYKKLHTFCYCGHEVPTSLPDNEFTDIVGYRASAMNDGKIKVNIVDVKVIESGKRNLEKPIVHLGGYEIFQDRIGGKIKFSTIPASEPVIDTSKLRHRHGDVIDYWPVTEEVATTYYHEGHYEVGSAYKNAINSIASLKVALASARSAATAAVKVAIADSVRQLREIAKENPEKFSGLSNEAEVSLQAILDDSLTKSYTFVELRKMIIAIEVELDGRSQLKPYKFPE